METFDIVICCNEPCRSKRRRTLFIFTPSLCQGILEPCLNSVGEPHGPIVGDSCVRRNTTDAANSRGQSQGLAANWGVPRIRTSLLVSVQVKCHWKTRCVPHRQGCSELRPFEPRAGVSRRRGACPGWRMGEAPPWGVAPDRQKKVPWTTLTSLSASRQVSTVLAVFSVYIQERYPFPFVFLHKGFLSLVLSSFYTKDFYSLSFIYLHKWFLSLIILSFFTQRIFIVGSFFLHK